MGLRIATNSLAIGAQRNLTVTQEKLQKTIQRLSSGSRIIQAADDPAGLAISDALNAEIRSLGAAIRNAQDGISLIQVFEGGTNELNNMLIRIRELAIQAASDTIGGKERSLLNNEVSQLISEVDRVARTTEFANRKLLSNEDINLEIQVGVNNDGEIDRIPFAPGDTNLTAGSLHIDSIDVSDKENAREALTTLDTALDRVNSVRSRVGSVQNRLTTTLQAQGIFRENLLGAKSRLRDADIAEETANLTKELILRQAGVAVLTQANQTPNLALTLLANV